MCSVGVGECVGEMATMWALFYSAQYNFIYNILYFNWISCWEELHEESGMWMIVRGHVESNWIKKIIFDEALWNEREWRPAVG